MSDQLVSDSSRKKGPESRDELLHTSVTYEPHMHVGDKDIYLAREHIKHVKMIADLTKNALHRQTSTKQEMRRFSKQYLDVLYPELSYSLKLKKRFNTSFDYYCSECCIPLANLSVFYSTITSD